MGKKKGNKGVQLAVTAVAAVATVVTMGAAAPIVGAAILGEIGGAAGAALATETILGSAATYASVTGGAVIGAAGGAIQGAAAASLVGADLADGALRGSVVGAVSGVAGLVGAGYASTALAETGADVALGQAGTKAVTEGVKGATANVVGAEMQGRDPLTAGLVGAIGGAATPIVGGLLNEGNLPGTLAGSATAATIGGALAGGARGALTGGNVLTGALTGGTFGGLGAYLEPQIAAGLANTLFGGASTTNVAEATGQQLTREQHLERINYLTEVYQQSLNNDLPEQASRVQAALREALSNYEADQPRLANAEISSAAQTTTPGTTITAGGGNAAAATGGTQANIRSTINDIYQRNFGRDADTGGMLYWTTSGLRGPALEQAIIAGAQGPDKTYYETQATRAAAGGTAQTAATSPLAATTTQASASDSPIQALLDLISPSSTATIGEAVTGTPAPDTTTQQMLDLIQPGDTSKAAVQPVVEPEEDAFSKIAREAQEQTPAAQVVTPRPTVQQPATTTPTGAASATDTTSKLLDLIQTGDTAQTIGDVVAGTTDAGRATATAPTTETTDPFTRIAEEAQETTPKTDIFVDGGTTTAGGGTVSEATTGTDVSTTPTGGTDGATTTTAGGGDGTTTVAGGDTDGTTTTVAAGGDGQSLTDQILQLIGGTDGGGGGIGTDGAEAGTTISLGDGTDGGGGGTDGGGAGDGGDGTDGGEGGGARPRDTSQDKVRISPIYIDPRVRRSPVQTGAGAPVTSAGPDSSSLSPLIGKYGRRNYIWNEQSLRLADALGIL